jgi:glycosyltransferase involved in cell wall biosynthesis
LIEPITRRKGGVNGRRIVIIASAIAKYDAISFDVHQTWTYLSQNEDWEVSVLSTRNDFADLPAKLVANLADLLICPEFLSADLIIYHFGIWHELFDAVNIGNGRAPQAMFFHNITPTEFTPPRYRATTAKSFSQLNAFRQVDRFWPVSKANAEMLEGMEFDTNKIVVIPGPVAEPPLKKLSEKAMKPSIEILFLGRIVSSKGVLDLVEAVKRIRGLDIPAFRVRIVGNLDYSDPAYSELVRTKIADYELSECVKFIGTVDQQARDRLLYESHILAIPSYHEGFCKPVIEGLRSGCIPVGYAAYNLKYIAEGLCRMVPPGDIPELAEAFANLITDLGRALSGSSDGIVLDRGKMYLPEFDLAVTTVVEKYEPYRVSKLMRQQVAQVIC